ncbi:MAG: tyrosine-type recombinase/integrase [Alcaligenaceae bacterium]|nr:tyrosine-type recombinase/integrase [Alcaligenaceae bacterium]
MQDRQDASDSDWVFPNPKTGKPYHSCRNAWVSACEKAGLAGLRMHDMRHTFASMMLDNGADIVDVQQALAHTQLKTTAVYLHLTEARKRLHANATSQATGLFA